jgi:hypothetical protein
MTRVAINGPLPDFDLTGFACIESFEFTEDLHPITYVWFGRHFSEKCWVPIVLLRYMLDAEILISLRVTEAIISYSSQKLVWLPEPNRFNIDDTRKEFPDLDEDHIIQIRKCRDEHDEKLAKDLGRKIIGKFTLGGSYDYKRHCTRLIMDDAELDFIIADTTEKSTFISRCNAYLSDGTKLGTIVSYLDGD